ncbi:MAG: MBL fold metallo-hydrolase [Chloroflexota bacterium]
MQKLIILGSSNALPTQNNENTHMVLVGDERMVLVDAPGSNTASRLEQAGLDSNDLTDIIATHFHMDHTLGIPQLLMNMWLMGRKRPLEIHGLDFTIDRVEALMNLYDWSEFPGFFPVVFHRIPPVEMTPVLDCSDFVIHTSPVHHVIPNIGLHVQLKTSNHVIAYSCDTEPCNEVIRLATGADILLHEAAGQVAGHSSAKQAGEIARKAEVGRLYLIHYPTGKYAAGDLVAEARTAFPGEVALAKDFMTLM